MCLQMGYCEQCDCLPVCEEKPAVKIRRELSVAQEAITPEEKDCIFLIMGAVAGAPDAGIMGIVF